MKKKNECSRKTGDRGERYARRFLRRLGYKIVGRNYRAAHGEIDVIARDGAKTVFVEVKSRTENAANTARYGRPADAVNSVKKARFLTAVSDYRRKHPESAECRIDVIEVYLPPRLGLFTKPRIVHVKNAFGEDARGSTRSGRK